MTLNINVWLFTLITVSVIDRCPINTQYIHLTPIQRLYDIELTLMKEHLNSQNHFYGL